MNGRKLSHYEAVGMMLDLIQFFRDGHVTTPRIIAERYGVSVRTAQRYLLVADRYVPLQKRGPNYRKAGLR